MLEQELNVIKDAERDCREMRRSARAKYETILHDAQTEGIRRHDELIAAAHTRGEAFLQETQNQVLSLQQSHAKEIAALVAALESRGRKRIPAAADTLFERMWGLGNRIDDEI